jgi:hypothetical protein
MMLENASARVKLNEEVRVLQLKYCNFQIDPIKAGQSLGKPTSWRTI